MARFLPFVHGFKIRVSELSQKSPQVSPWPLLAPPKAGFCGRRRTYLISPWVNFCCLTRISIVDSYISKMMAARAVVGQEGCEKARTCRGLAQGCARLCKVLQVRC